MMNTVRLFLVILFSASSAAAQEFKWADDSRFLPFLKNGQVLNLHSSPTGTPYNDLISTVYKGNDGKIIVLSGSIGGIREMVQREFPSGVDRSFISEQLVKILAACLPSDRTDSLITDRSLKMVRSEVSDGAFYQRNLDLLEVPRTNITGNRWKILFMSGDRRGDIVVRVCRGELAPFEIDSVLAITVRDRTMADPNWIESKRRKIEAESAFDSAP